MNKICQSNSYATNLYIPRIQNIMVYAQTVSSIHPIASNLQLQVADGWFIKETLKLQIYHTPHTKDMYQICHHKERYIKTIKIS